MVAAPLHIECPSKEADKEAAFVWFVSYRVLPIQDAA